MKATVSIQSLGRRGDGIAQIDGETAHVAFALPGEEVVAERHGRRWHAAEILKPSSDRVDPVCRHFGQCGGCQLQHYASIAQDEWKRGIVVDALARENLPIDRVQPTLSFEHLGQSGLRRRAVFNAIRTGSGVVLGFLKRESKQTIDIRECPVLAEAIVHRLDGLRDLCAPMLGRRQELKLAVLATPAGLDVSATSRTPLAAAAPQTVVKKALALDLARLSHNGETLIESRRPWLAAGAARVTPSPGGFVQAVEAAETAMAELVCGHLAGCRRMADLFSGHGAFALRLAASGPVHAVEADAPALTALDRAWREASGSLKPVTHERRDLFRRPLLVDELKRFDGIVFDPPRAGAEAQCKMLARSKVRKIAAVSCNPVTLARDLRLLVDGGYRLVSVTPVDQFRHSAHVEAVALLER